MENEHTHTLTMTSDEKTNDYAPEKIYSDVPNLDLIHE